MFGKKKLLYITYDGLTDPLGRSQILPYLIGIAFAGYDVTVLSCEKRNVYRHKKSTVKKMLKLSNICWKKKFYSKKPPVFSTLWDLWRMKSKATSLHSKHSFNIIHCRSILSAWIGKKLQDEHTKFVFDIRGFWADERVEGGLWNLENKLYQKIYKYFKGVEAELFEHSDHIISLTDKAKKHIIENHKSRKLNDISVIPCSVELMAFDPNKYQQNEIEEKKKLLGILPGDFVLGYIGSLGTRYMAEEMLHFFAELKNSIPQSKFLLVTNGGENIILESAKKLDLVHSVINYKADYSEMPLMIALLDAAVYFIKAGFSGIAASPTKQAELLAMGKPVVINSGIGDSDGIIGNNKCGVIVSEFSEQSYKKAVEELEIILKRKPEDIRKIAERYFSMEGAIEKYVSAYKQLA